MALIDLELVKHPTTHGLLSYKQYGFRYSRATTDVLMVIDERIYQALYKNGEVMGTYPVLRTQNRSLSCFQIAFQ